MTAATLNILSSLPSVPEARTAMRQARLGDARASLQAALDVGSS
jgi:hypothetical protein